jgi:hypothetical protein
MSKGFYALKFDGQVQALYGTHSGGETIQKNYEVALGNRPATMVKVPSGALEFIDLELELEDRPADGLYLDDLITAIIASNQQKLDDSGGPSEPLELQLVMYKDADFKEPRSTLTLKQAWVSAYKLPEGDRKASEVRSMSVTVSHRGSTYGDPNAGGETT